MLTLLKNTEISNAAFAFFKEQQRVTDKPDNDLKD